MPCVTAIIGILEPGSAPVNIVHAKCPRKIRARKVHGLLQFHQRRRRLAGGFRAVQRFAAGYEEALLRRMLMRPGPAAVQTARQPVLFGLFAVNMMAGRPQVLIVAEAVAHNNFIAPMPHAVVCRPARKTAGFVMHLDMLRLFRNKQWFAG
ncbi:MAG TPA: hypothetical protein ENN29_04185 [Candidatus Hydrogenedentes bacterium]|nr:hypothetical protein [Candidatus Hydrogenedentota bacterium]